MCRIGPPTQRTGLFSVLSLKRWRERRRRSTTMATQKTEGHAREAGSTQHKIPQKYGSTYVTEACARAQRAKIVTQKQERTDRVSSQTPIGKLMEKVLGRISKPLLPLHVRLRTTSRTMKAAIMAIRRWSFATGTLLIRYFVPFLSPSHENNLGSHCSVQTPKIRQDFPCQQSTAKAGTKRLSDMVRSKIFIFNVQQRGEQQMSQFSFAADTKSEHYCKDVVDALTQEFGISRIQALSLLNHQWDGQNFVGEEDVRYHLGEPRAWATYWKRRECLLCIWRWTSSGSRWDPFPLPPTRNRSSIVKRWSMGLFGILICLPSQALSVLNRQWRGLDVWVTMI